MKKTPRNEFKDVLDSISAFLKLEKEARSGEYLAPPGEGPDKEWNEIEKEMLHCRKCDLYKTRHNVVVGSGNRRARLVFVGEAPGREEDVQGKPFVGRAGALLTRIIEAMGSKRKDVYIANVLKCRPPNNRPPLPTEILACQENLHRQLDLIGPKVICTLGKFASQTLLKTDTPISRIRGRFYEYRGIKLMPTFHPAYLLRNPGEKRLVWQDIKKVIAELKNKKKR
ncbi:uracil-DNA glycosylase [Candidatus Omnitrophota bacterium]